MHGNVSIKYELRTTFIRDLARIDAFCSHVWVSFQFLVAAHSIHFSLTPSPMPIPEQAFTVNLIVSKMTHAHQVSIAAASK